MSPQVGRTGARNVKAERKLSQEDDGNRNLNGRQVLGIEDAVWMILEQACNDVEEGQPGHGQIPGKFVARYKGSDRLPSPSRFRLDSLRVHTESLSGFLRRVERSKFATMVGTCAAFPARQAELAIHTLRDVSVVWNVFSPEAGDAREVTAEGRIWWVVDEIASAEVVVPWV